MNIISTGELKQQNDGFSPIIVDIFDDGTSKIGVFAIHHFLLAELPSRKHTKKMWKT